MIKKLLIANRGEIAMRLVRACADSGISSVALYTEPDRYALHVKQANESYCLGPESIAGYLNPHLIVNVARETGADAIHPGYGFLSENPELANICQKRGITYVGPTADAISQMGDKLNARAVMQKAGIPVVPGSDVNIQSIEEAQKIAKKIGYPIMLKATGGGGGRGIRKCDDETMLKSQFDRVKSEAQKAFGSTDIYIEKFIHHPRHIEVQILADSKGNCIHLYERDCSIQRRHQKLIEIAPSPQINESQRKTVCDYALKAAHASKYQNAGTVEFILDEKGQFYFLEMNTRLQVEHPITEQITGLDIVREQFRIAEGKALSITQEAVSRRGMAIEFRINAEDPQNDFLPDLGRITRYYAPGGPGVRTDSAIYTGYEIPPYYDSLCAKLIVWAYHWDELLARSKRALKEMKLYGIKTTIPYYLNILENPDFQAQSFDTGFIEKHPELLKYKKELLPQHLAAAIAASFSYYHER